MPSTASKPAAPSPPPLGTVLDDGNGTLELVSVLGCGGYGVVYRARDTRISFPTFYAVKCLIRPSTNIHTRQRQLHLREIALHQLASPHPHVVSVHRVIDPPQSPYTFLVMDYCPDGDLFSMILHNRRYLGHDGLIKHVFLQLLEAVEYCHSLGIYHRDLKPENVLCFNNGLTLAVTDFGLATTDKVSAEFRTGSVYHMSPECQGGAFAPSGTYSPASNDIWSLGIILLNLCTGRNPWKSATASDQTFAAYLASPSDFLPSVLPISQQLNALLIGVLNIDWTRRIGLKEFREKVKHVDSFYSDDAVFEGSMARCPWEVGMNLDGDGEETSEASASYSPQAPSTPSTKQETTRVAQKPSIQVKSRWSADSDPSEIVFATASRAQEPSYASSHANTMTSGATQGTPSPLMGRKRKPNLKLDIRHPALDTLRAQQNTSPTVRSSDGTFTFGISSQAVSMRSTSPGFPETPPIDARFDYVRSADDITSAAPSLGALSEAESASYHTSFDGESLEASGFAYGSDSISGIFKVLPSPEGEQKGRNFTHYRNYFRSSSPSPASSFFYFVPERQRSDFSMQSPGDGFASSPMDADWVADAEDDDVTCGRSPDESMSVGADENAMREEFEEEAGARGGEDPVFPSSWTWSNPSLQNVGYSFTFTTTRSASMSYASSPIVADTNDDDDDEREQASVRVGLGLDLYPDEGRSNSSGPLENPWELPLDTSGWGMSGEFWASSPSEAAAAENFPSQSTPDSTCTSSSAGQTPNIPMHIFSPRPLPTPPDSALTSPSSVSHFEIHTAFRTTLSRAIPPSFQYIPPAPTYAKDAKAPSRSFLRFAFLRAFSSSSPSPSSRLSSGPPSTFTTPPPPPTHAIRPLAPRSKTDPATTAAPAPAPAKPTTTTQAPPARRGRFSSTGYGPRARALDHARSRTRSKTRSRSLSRPPSPRNMLRTARHWFSFSGSAPGKFFERAGPTLVAAAA